MVTFDEPLEASDIALVTHSKTNRVLIVDDDAQQIQVLTHGLESQGYQVMAARSGEDALIAVRGKRPDLIFMDIRLPGADGLEICEELSDDAETCNIPVIIVSASDDPNVVRRARSAGCLYFLRKPYDPNALLLLAQNALNASEDNWANEL